MYRYILQIPVNTSFNNGGRLFPCAKRDYCNVIKSNKKRAAKVLSSDVSKLSIPNIIEEEGVANDINQKQSTSLCKNMPDSTESSSLVDKTTSKLKKQIKTATKNDTKKTGKEKKSAKSISAESEPDRKTNVSLSERYGNSLNVPGMKPFSTVKTTKEKRDLSSAELSDKKCGDSQEDSAVSKSVPTIQATIDISEIIPKLCTPSFRLEQKLDVPSEWAVMADSWTPSLGFLKSILDFPIEGLEKWTDFHEKKTDYVRCFVTGNKNATRVVPAVTTVLSKTITPAQAYGLKLWRQRLTKQLGEEGFQQHRTETLTRGKQFHDTIQRYLLGESVQNLNIEDLPLITGCWKSLVPVLNRIDGVLAVESEVLHPQLLYRGIIDSIVEIKGQPFIVEWKHSSRRRESLQKNYDSPVQLMAYTGAINSNASYPFGVKKSLLVVAYEDGSPADVFLLSAPENGEHHWHTWLKRLHTYWTLLKAERELGD